MVRLKAAWAAEVIESASSRITILKGGHGLPLNTHIKKKLALVHVVLRDHTAEVRISEKQELIQHYGSDPATLLC